MEYKPDKPYVIKEGRRTGKSLEILMFQDYEWLRQMYNFLEEKKAVKKNSFHSHLEWILKRGEFLKPKIICPFCEERVAKKFFVRFSGGFYLLTSKDFVYCNDKDCNFKEEKLLLSGEGISVYHLKFSSLSAFQRKEDKKKMAKFYKEVFGLPKRLTKEVAFKFFNE